ncbi:MULTISPECIES: thermonuclease family protein [Pseudomonas syringae group]|uniref:thermonuclease family protein n=1 Tax=Pseudomonas syringae group TaxID=136849 RepID=UPI0005B7090C|nr:thermonuclease family protein [Pseudomonas viridiflava]MBD8568638.1 thermonuclease family protein [Pseudomonas syringae]KIQ35524.1 nuclease [Pseudomonas viridiflava]MBI6704867.1 thermonuclease family protein [Pseudomonas viridiflava]MBI6722155.1 thermonuclease family protein [Pseudomonas viridiflava]MEE4226566.1 thermonuclease family protein [Pseudomonas viridiflava]
MGISRLLEKTPLVGVFFMSAIWLSDAQAFCPAPAGLPVAKVQRVVDGDTLRLSDGRSVRMIGLNTPETGKRGQSAEPFAEAGKRRLQALVKDSGDQVRLQIGQQAKDRYGRTLANVYSRNGTNLEAQLLSEGLGYLVAFAPNTALVDCQQSAERQARQARLGLWRNSPVQAANRINKGGFAVVTGRVKSVQRNRGGVWIELDGSLVLRVAPDLLSAFDVAKLERLKGQQIEARGWVVDRSRRGGLQSGQARWLMPLTHPAMLNP